MWLFVNKMKSFSTFVSSILLIITLLLSVAIILGFAADLHPALDSFSHLRKHLSVLMMLASALLLLTRFRREALLALLFAIGSFATTRDAMNSAMLPQDKITQSEGVSYTLLQLNLLFNHPEPRAMLQLVANAKPDIITLQEVSSHWLPWIEILQGSYPYQQICKEHSNSWGVAILSRRPFTDEQGGICVDDGVLALANINMGGTILTVGAVHFSWPWPFEQPSQMDYIEPSLKQLSAPLILSGDFNATPWSAVMRRVASVSNTYLLPNIGATWLTNKLPASWIGALGLQIDNILVSKDIHVQSASSLGAVQSDHLPLLLRFSLPVTPSEPDYDLPASGIVAVN